ncbi:MAG: S41 family peptidase [Candidatus Aminicenantales bacterium]
MTKKAFLVIVLILTFIQLGARDEDVWNLGLEKISSISTLIKNNYFENVEPEKLTYSSIIGMLQTLDPHSYFLDPDSFSRMFEEQKGRYSGLGIQIQKQNDRLMVISPIEGTPAWRLGIQAGDIITHINGESTKPITDREAVQKLRGPKGTKVNITIAREGLDKPLELTVVREEIPLYSVPYAFRIQDGVGYIFIRYFAETTASEFEEKMRALTLQGMKSLILDLRGNTGGPLFQSIEVSDEFLPKGAPIVSIKGRNRNYEKEFFAERNNQYERLPLIVLINQGSASASEIVAGAIMDNDRGLVVGEDSWGKGLVQTIFPLAPNMAVALTTAKYFTPSGRSIQRDYTHLDDYIFNSEVPEKEREVKFTAKGRKVLGQGGITPDYIVKFYLHSYTVELMVRGAFFSYARKFFNHQTDLSQNFIFPSEASRDASRLQGRIRIGQSFKVDFNVLEDFKKYLKLNQIAFNQKKFLEAESEIRRELEREIYSAIWGQEESMKAYRKSDAVILKALEVLPEALKFIE